MCRNVYIGGQDSKLPRRVKAARDSLLPLAPLLFLELAIALFRAFERFGRAHRLACVAQQLHQAADEDHGDDDERDEEFGHGRIVTGCAP